jgi:hypothetical protein
MLEWPAAASPCGSVQSEGQSPSQHFTVLEVEGAYGDAQHRSGRIPFDGRLKAAYSASLIDDRAS